MGARRKARECALQMLFAADVADTNRSSLTRDFWSELSDEDFDEATRAFADNLTLGTLRRLTEIDDKIRTRAEHWRIERMAIVDRNILRLAVNDRPVLLGRFQGMKSTSFNARVWRNIFLRFTKVMAVIRSTGSPRFIENSSFVSILASDSK